MRTLTKITLLLTATVAALFFSFTRLNDHNMKNIDAFLKQHVDGNQTPSVQYAFFDADSIIYSRRYGVRSVGQQLPVDAHTTYHLYSVTKTFTALAILQLAESGKLGLDQPAVDFLPDFPYQTAVTIRQLMNHTAGIPNPMPLRWIHLAEEHERFDHDAFYKKVFTENPKLDFAPGTRFRYSNLGYVLLGQIVEAASGESFEHYVQAHIIDKLGLGPGDLSFSIDTSRHAVGYHKFWSVTNAALAFLIDKNRFMGSREGKWKPFRTFYNNGTAYGGLSGSSVAMVRYAQELISEHSVLIGDQHRSIMFSESTIGARPTGMSYSWFKGKLKGHRYYAHAGGGGGYYVEVRVYPDLHVGSVIMFNRSGMTDERLLDKADAFFITER